MLTYSLPYVCYHMITDNNNLLYKNYKVKIKLDLPILLKPLKIYQWVLQNINFQA